MLATPEIIQETEQWNRLEQALPQWFTRPLYQARGMAPLNAAGLDRLPLVTKQDLRGNFPQNFLTPAESLDALLEARAVELEYTSGTSEDRVPVLLPQGWWDAQEERALRLNHRVAAMLDQHPAPRRATLTTPVCNGQSCPSKWLTRAQRTIGRTLFVNHARLPWLLTDTELAQMAAEIADWQPQLLDLDPVHGAWFALYCERQGLRFPSLRFILCSYEFVSVVHRRIIERVFGVPVWNLYGATETGHLLMEGADGAMLPSRETAFLEVIEPEARGIGQLVVTSLSNDRMPLVRYRIGDLVEVQRQPYRTTYRVHGRTRDALRNANGRRVTTWDVDQCFHGVTNVVHYQLRQAENGSCSLRCLPEDRERPLPDLQPVARRLEALLGLSEPLQIEVVDTLLPAQSGKFRLTCPA